MATTTTSRVDPTIQPFLNYGLTEAQRIYQGGGPHTMVVKPMLAHLVQLKQAYRL